MTNEQIEQKKQQLKQLAEEVKALIPKLTAQGFADAAMMLDSCVSSYHDGNEWLAAALRKLEKHGA